MTKKFSESFKIQAVKKVLNKDEQTTITDISTDLGIGLSTLNRWRREIKSSALVSNKSQNKSDEKRPYDFNLQERFNLVIESHQLDEVQTNEFCRERGLYPHHIKQWEIDFVSGNNEKTDSVKKSEIRALKEENKRLKRMINRKDKALAETAALLVLQKKVHDIWGENEDS